MESEEFTASSYTIILLPILTFDYREDRDVPYYDRHLNTTELTFNHVKCEVRKSLMCNMGKD